MNFSNSKHRLSKIASTSSKVPLAKSFLRGQTAAVGATIADYGLMIFFKEIAFSSIVLATGFGFVAGSIVNFYLGRHWAFQQKDGHISKQAIRFLITAIIGLLLNMGGMYWLSDVLGWQYIIARVVTTVVVGFGFSFAMYRYFVFR